jgi:adenosine deaminase
MTDDDLAQLARNSFTAAFVPDDDRARWLAEVDAAQR